MMQQHCLSIWGCFTVTCLNKLCKHTKSSIQTSAVHIQWVCSCDWFIFKKTKNICWCQYDCQYIAHACWQCLHIIYWQCFLYYVSVLTLLVYCLLYVVEIEYLFISYRLGLPGMMIFCQSGGFDISWSILWWRVWCHTYGGRNKIMLQWTKCCTNILFIGNYMFFPPAFIKEPSTIYMVDGSLSYPWSWIVSSCSTFSTPFFSTQFSLTSHWDVMRMCWPTMWMEVRSTSARDTTGGAPLTLSMTPLTSTPMLSRVGWLLSFSGVQKTSYRFGSSKKLALSFIQSKHFSAPEGNDCVTDSVGCCSTLVKHCLSTVA